MRGYIRWTDDNGDTHPARNVDVEIYCGSGSTSALLATVSTNANGYYSKSVLIGSGSMDVFIRVKSSGLNVTVQNSAGVTYIHQSSVVNNLAANDTATISYTANKTTPLGKSMGIHQAMELANRFMYTLEGKYLDNVNVSYPTSKSTSLFDGVKIHILESDAFDWDVIEHEYGHYVQSCFGITQNPGGTHYYNANMADRLGKDKGIKLAWGEGWATYFAINLQKEMNAGSMNIPYVGDTKYTDIEKNGTIEYDIETVNSSYLLGEANEVVVSGILYDLTDPSNSADYDNIYLRTVDVWNITKANYCCTLSDLITEIYKATYTTETKLKIGVTLSHFQVAANLKTPSNLSSLPTFSWTKQGGSTTYTNNSFTLAFYDSSYKLISRIAVGNVSSVTLSTSQWNTIKSGRSGSTVYCCVETKQTAAPATGAYYSNLITIKIPT